MEGHLLSSKSTNLILISSENTLTENSGIIFDQISGYHGPAKLMHKINQHGAFFQAGYVT